MVERHSTRNRSSKARGANAGDASCSLELLVDRLRRGAVEPLLDPEHRRERLAQPEPGRGQREQVEVVGEHLPDRAVVDLLPAVARHEPGALERHTLRVQHPNDVVVGRDEQPAGRVEPRRGIGEEPHVDVPVRADERQLRDAAVQVEAELRRVDVPVRSQVRHRPSPAFGR